MIEALLSEGDRALRDEVRRFVADEVPAELVRAMDADQVHYPRDYVAALGRANLLGLRFPRQWGGRGLGWTSEIVALEEIGVLGASLACLYSLPSIVGEALWRFGSDDQRARYLRPMLAGDKTCAEALTEPRGGSDFFGATCRAVRDGDGYLLSGQKRFVVGAEGADFFLVYARSSDDPDPHRRISLFLVDRGPGVKVEHLYGLMGTRGGGAGRIVFSDARVPLANRVGAEGAGGEIFNRMMIPERMTSAAGVCGTARAALEVAARYSTKRKAFGKTIDRFEGVSFRIADAVSELDAARALTYAAARTVDSDRDARRLVSEAKKVATENAWAIVNHAMQVMGGIGYTDVFPIERLLRDTRLALIWTGTNEIMNLLIQHEYYAELGAAKPHQRDVERDAAHGEMAAEKVFE
ncbi:MAG: acyl-CoA/acyl-ACP dehydrogenase [Deltaproteobacteria bacterium]|nr:acyl-CoA/acyl-ACP dehydrogenase [Deltaproteobacteria bacterium]